MKCLKYWTVEGFEVSSYKWKLSERISSVYRYSGSDNTGLCKYTYNELGFRGDSIFKTGFKIMSIGCSMTEGVGVNDNETWPHLLTSLIPGAVNMNFGFSGRSNDYISRCLLTYYDLVKPDLVLIMYSETSRRDFITSNGGIEPFHTKPWGYFEEDEIGKDEYKSLINLSNKENDFQNWYKNHLLIKYFLESKKCNWVWNGWWLEADYKEKNRFDGEYDKFIDTGVDGMHPGPISNKLYAEKLYNYVKELGYLEKNEYISKNKNKLL